MVFGYRISCLLCIGLILSAAILYYPASVRGAEFDDFEAPPIQEAVETPPDPVKEMLLSFFDRVQGRAGDITVLVSAALMCLAFWRKMYRASIGMLVLLVGVVLLRITISVLFGGD